MSRKRPAAGGESCAQAALAVRTHRLESKNTHRLESKIKVEKRRSFGYNNEGSHTVIQPREKYKGKKARNFCA